METSSAQLIFILIKYLCVAQSGELNTSGLPNSIHIHACTVNRSMYVYTTKIQWLSLRNFETYHEVKAERKLLENQTFEVASP